MGAPGRTKVSVAVAIYFVVFSLIILFVAFKAITWARRKDKEASGQPAGTEPDVATGESTSTGGSEGTPS
jgi:hypothetical protein